MKSLLKVDETFGGRFQTCVGEIEFEVKDRNGLVISRQRERNIIKIPAKEVLAHRLPHRRVWDPSANSGTGGWVSSGIDVNEELSAKYIVFGASFDEDNLPLDANDDRYYVSDSATGGIVPVTLGPGAEYNGGLINAVPIAEPVRPLKRIERVYFEPSYQPAGTPLLQDDVRALNNIVVMETTLLKDEYNGLAPASNFLTITEVALVAGKDLDAVGSCECDPHTLFLEGSADGSAILATATGGDTITIHPSEVAAVDVIKEGDTVKIVSAETTVTDTETLNQVTPYYLVVSKAAGGSDITLDRVPSDADNVPLTGQIGLFKDGFRIISHRILATPFKKSSSFIVTCRWRWIFG